MKEIKKYFTNGQLAQVHFEDEFSRKQGDVRNYHDNGLLKSITVYINDSRQYSKQLYYSNGNLQEIENRDIQVGSYSYSASYNNAGIIVSETIPDPVTQTIRMLRYCGTTKKIITQDITILPNGNKTGQFTTRFNSGLLRDQCYFVNDMRHGSAITWHDSVKWTTEEPGVGEFEQIKAQTMTYVNNKIEGDVDEYHSNGQLYRKYTIKNGTRVGHYTEYSKDGILTYETEYTDRGSIKHEEKRYHSATGCIAFHRILNDDGNTAEEHKFAYNGNPMESVYWEYKRYSRFYKEIKRYANGVLEYHATYDNSVPNKTSYSEVTYNVETGHRVSLTESKHTDESKVSLKFHYSADGNPRRISLVVDDEYQTTDFKKLLKKKTSEINDADIAYIKLAYF